MCYVPSELSADFSNGLFSNELLQIVKNLSVHVLEVHEPGDNVLFCVKSRDLWSRMGRISRRGEGIFVLVTRSSCDIRWQLVTPMQH